MKVARPVVVRILQSARKKIANSLINGYAIRMEDQEDNNRGLKRCRRCKLDSCKQKGLVEP